MTTETVDAGTTNPGTGTTPAPAGQDQIQGTEAPGAGVAPAGDTPKPGEPNADVKGAVPEKYEFAVPEGVELNGKAAEEFSEIAKELKLSQADAQRIADVAVKMQQQQAEAHAEMAKGWADQCKTDKEFGGDNLQQNLSVARKAIDTFGSPELKALLNSSGLGNHPEVVRFAFKAGKAISEDTFVKAGARVPTPETSMEKRLYPDMN